MNRKIVNYLNFENIANNSILSIHLLLIPPK